MGETTFRRVEEVFHEALELPSDQRGAFLDRVCDGDDAVRREVERLLKLDGEQAGLLDTAPWKHRGPTAEIEVTVDPVAQPGARIGRYRLLERLATGGMGAVWLAERADEHFDQRVAIKVIKRGMDTEDILHRFRTERQVLAGLQHPNIARLLDGGATDDGRPYLVMEYIDGQPIDTYWRTQDSTQRERIELFIKVCQAVQAAHRNLVIHRDLKPTNILVTRDGTPKLLDFGIAKVLSYDGAAVTATGLRVMTPMYASPEQIRGDRVTTSSDVYALGVVLYELIAGRGPYRLKTRTRGEIERAVLRQEPMRPSTAVGRLTVAGDLDTIILKALSKEPDDRYGSPEQLAEDLQRFLDGLPILARPAGVGTRVIKALRRNRRSVAAAGVAATLSLVFAIAVSLYIFVVPLWVQDQLDAARLELLDPGQQNVIYIAVYMHDRGVRVGSQSLDFTKALDHYDAALRLYPTRSDIRLERDLVRHAGGDPTKIDESALDDRSRGLLQMLTGDLRSAVRTWSSLDLVASPDPLVEGLLGILYLAVDEPARAYPRLTSAHKALPEAGFLCVSLADAAAHCGDAEMALRLIERAKSLSKIEDGTGGLRRVEADALAAAGKYEEAAAKYETFRPAHNLVGILHYADMLDGLGRPREGLAMLANGIQTVTNWTKVNRAFIERADRWWAGLDDRQRTVLAESRRDDDPCDPQSLSALLFAYRVATLQVQRAGPPLNLTGQPTPPPAKPAPMTPTPSLSEIAATIPVTDLQAWVFINRFPDSALTPRVRANLAGPERTLSAETRGEFEAWMREWKAVNKPGRVRQYFGFAPQ